MKTFSLMKNHFWTIWLDIFELTGGKGELEEMLQLVPMHEWSALVGKCVFHLLKLTEKTKSSWAESLRRKLPSGLSANNSSASYLSIFPQ